MSSSYGSAFECYAAIGRWLAESAPEEWKRLSVDFKIIEIDDVSECRIWYAPKKFWRKEGSFPIYDTGFDECFFALAKLSSTPEKGLFKKCLFVLSSDGTYKVEFEY